MKSGIYTIFNKTTGKLYIGSSKNVPLRLRHHRSCLRGNYHINHFLQRAWNKYGESAFSFKQIQLVPETDLLVKEGYYINTLKTYDKDYGYNIQKDPFRHSVSEETKAKISVARKGTKQHPNNRAALLKANVGKKFTEEHKRAIGFKLQKKIAQCNLDGTLIKEWDSIKEASAHFNTPATNISSVLNGKSRTACNYIWRFT